MPKSSMSDVSSAQPESVVSQTYAQIFAKGLPELESVTCSPREYLSVAWIGLVFLTLVSAAVIAALFGVIMILFHKPWPEAYQLGVVAILAGVLVGNLLARSKLLAYSYETNSLGLKIKGIKGEWFAAWSSITSARMTRTDGLGSLSLLSTQGKFAVNVSPGTNDVLLASIWQHLSRVGKADNLVPPVGLLSLYAPIPNTVPQEMDWGSMGQNRLDPKVMLVILALAGVVVLAMLRHNVLDKVHSWAGHLIWSGIVFVYVAFRVQLINARRVMVRTDRIEAYTAFGRIDLEWDQITVARWAHNTFTVGRKGFSRVVAIPYDTNDPGTANLILSVIRHLRTRHNRMAVPIPPPLMVTTLIRTASPGVAKPCSWKYPIAIPIIMAAVVLMICVFLLLLRQDFSFARYLLLAMPFEVIACLYLFTYSMSVDEKGITITRLWQKKHYEWWQITRYVVQAKNNFNMRVNALYDTDGKIVVKFMTSHFPDQINVQAYCDAKLAGVRTDVVA